MERDPIGFDLVEQPVSIGFPFFPKDALNFNGSSGRHLNVAHGSVMFPKDQNPVVEVENKLDEMFRVVEMQFQPRDGSSDSNRFLVVSAGGLKQFRNRDDLDKSFIFNWLQKTWREEMAGKERFCRYDEPQPEDTHILPGLHEFDALSHVCLPCSRFGYLEGNRASGID